MLKIKCVIVRDEPFGKLGALLNYEIYHVKKIVFEYNQLYITHKLGKNSKRTMCDVIDLSNATFTIEDDCMYINFNREDE